MLGWLCVALGVAFGSAIIPLISVEVFVIGLVASKPSTHWLAIGAVVAVGQVAGKLLYFLAARGSIELPRFLRDRPRREKPSSPRRKRWRLRTKSLRATLNSLRERCHQHPHWMISTYATSAVIGLPPFMATSVLAGLVKMRLSTFIAVGLLGRWTRFSALAASPALFKAWLQL